METKAYFKLSFWRKVAFGLGDIYGGGSMVVIGFYYLVFLTDVVRINPALAGTVILISKLYDSITDPLEGILTDRTRTRFGRRKPYLMAGIPLVFLSFFLMWYPTTLESEIGRFFFVLVTYLFFSTTVSIVLLSYNAAIPQLVLLGVQLNLFGQCIACDQSPAELSGISAGYRRTKEKPQMPAPSAAFKITGNAATFQDGCHGCHRLVLWFIIGIDHYRTGLADLILNALEERSLVHEAITITN